MRYSSLIALAREQGLDVREQPGLPEQGCYAAEPGRRAVLLIRGELGEADKLLVLTRGLGIHATRQEQLMLEVIQENRQ